MACTGVGMVRFKKIPIFEQNPLVNVDGLLVVVAHVVNRRESQLCDGVCDGVCV